MHYERYLAAGLPIGTGVIKGPVGIWWLIAWMASHRWSPKGAEAILRLRTTLQR